MMPFFYILSYCLIYAVPILSHLGMPVNLSSGAQHQHLPAGQPGLFPCQSNFLLHRIP